jgi:hypothetical protein
MELVYQLKKMHHLVSKLSDVKKELSRVSEQDIPSLLGGLDSVVKLKDGRKVTVKEKIRCYALKEDKPEAYQWLLDNDGEDIVNQVVVVTIPSGTIGGLEEVLKLLDKSEMVLDVSNVLSVQWQQLDSKISRCYSIKPFTVHITIIKRTIFFFYFNNFSHIIPY